MGGYSNLYDRGLSCITCITCIICWSDFAYMLKNYLNQPVNFASIPYVRGASDRVGRVRRKLNIRTAVKPCQTLSQIFKKPNDRLQVHQRRGTVYKVRCNDFAFTYIGESKRSWSSRGAEHDPGRACNGDSAIKQHTESTEHDIHPRNDTVDCNAVNERKPLPRAYTPLLRN